MGAREGGAKPRRVLVAMSGGVDSSVAAWLVAEQGLELVGATMRLVSDDLAGVAGGIAREQEREAEAAGRICTRLGIEHVVLDCRREFERDVVEPFCAAYEWGETPNPCIMCNRRVKFGTLLDRARELGCDAVATGHYARVLRSPGRVALGRAADASKDQSYFLYGIGREALERAIFPLGGLIKDRDVRRIAREQGFECAEKRDSQGICFAADDDFAAFIERRRGRALEEGTVLDTEGNAIGRHRGAIRYTVGQRRGIGVASSRPLYVCRLDAAANTVVLGGEEDLMAGALLARDWVWTSPADQMEAELDRADAGEPFLVGAKIRYHQQDQPARLSRAEGGLVRVDFDRAQRAVAPGQAVVVYRGDEVLGGGTVLRAAE